MLLLFNNLHEKSITESKDKKKIGSVLFMICTCVTTFHSCYMKNVLTFSQPDMYIINKETLTLTTLGVTTESHEFYHCLPFLVQH